MKKQYIKKDNNCLITVQYKKAEEICKKIRIQLFLIHLRFEVNVFTFSHHLSHIEFPR